MANEFSQFYTCITPASNVNKNENIPKRYSLPTKLSFSSNNSYNSVHENQKNENENAVVKDNDDNGNQKECSELIMETQQKLQNLRLESYIRTFPFPPYSKYAMEEKERNYNYNYTEVINTKERVNNKRKLNSNTSSLIQETESNNKKQHSTESHGKISEVKKIKSSFNKSNNNPNPCEINEVNNNNHNSYGVNVNSCEVKENNINNVNDILNQQINNNNNNNRIKQEENKPKIVNLIDNDEKSDYKKLDGVNNNNNNNNNNNQFWGILQSINPKFQTIYLKESQIKKECFIGRNKNCDIRINLPQISGMHCKIFYVHKILLYIIFVLLTENKSKISGYITREYYLQDLRGSFGTVCKAIRKCDNHEVAIKIVSKKKLNSKPGSNLMKYLEREVNILKSIKHKNIIQLHDVYEDSTNVYLVLELAKGGELFNRIRMLKKLTENQTRIVMKQLFSALEYLHNRGIAHRDLKPENILMQSPNDNNFSIKLSDFGLSRFVDDNFYMRTLCGTPNYTAPEVFDKNVKNYTIAVDMWSCGVIMYICLCGYTPFSRKNSKYPLKTQILNGLYTFKPEHWNTVSDEAILLIKLLLQVNPNLRITVSQALNHPFITKDDTKMQVDYELKRKRDSQILKDEDSSIVANKDFLTADLDCFFNNKSNDSNKLKRQKLLYNLHI
ncbi:hypothetical protein PIROE2DRAFT_64098 [Piromyces sp. E2]|nr:hypothetical protein PIROE2DRAFT_64098 [Piromyces sp. E2]|eukprot:OUM58924.1 hypothetical protein PIROE2DRAFT_64098 [Piromyces sp. E2]